MHGRRREDGSHRTSPRAPGLRGGKPKVCAGRPQPSMQDQGGRRERRLSMPVKIVRSGDVELWTEGIGRPVDAPVLLIMGAMSAIAFSPPRSCRKWAWLSINHLSSRSPRRRAATSSWRRGASGRPSRSAGAGRPCLRRGAGPSGPGTPRAGPLTPPPRWGDLQGPSGGAACVGAAEMAEIEDLARGRFRWFPARTVPPNGL
jgi:hypothetical protein